MDTLRAEPLPDDGEALLAFRGAQRNALCRRAQALQDTSRELRAESRAIVARCVEGRIVRGERSYRTPSGIYAFE